MASPSGDTAAQLGRLESVNVGAIREVEHNGRTITTGIFKSPTSEPQMITGVHVGADEQADTEAHGGPDKAVYAYAAEDYAWWQGELERSIDPGLFGENLLTSGIDVSGARVGDRWHIGDAVLEVSEPRVPCFKLSIAVGAPRFQQRFGAANRPGAYLRIVGDGLVKAGDSVEVRPTTEESISVTTINEIYHGERERAGELLDIPALSDAWKRWAREASGA